MNHFIFFNLTFLFFIFSKKGVASNKLLRQLQKHITEKIVDPHISVKINIKF